MSYLENGAKFNNRQNWRVCWLHRTSHNTNQRVNVILMLCYAYLLSHVQLFATLWTTAYQAPLSMGILQAKILKWIAISFSRGSSQSTYWTQVSCIAGGFFTIQATIEQCVYVNPSLLVYPSLLPLWYPEVFCLCLCIYFCFMCKLI